MIQLVSEISRVLAKPSRRGHTNYPTGNEFNGFVIIILLLSGSPDTAC
jgi:hypothetical protein